MQNPRSIGVIFLFFGLCLCAGKYSFAEEIPFRLVTGYLILVKGSIGPLSDLTFLIDTGATSTHITRHLAKKLGLEGRPRQVASYSQSFIAEQTVLNNIYLGRLEFDAVPVLINNFEGLGSHGTHIDAIIGMNLLKRTGLRIDYDRRKLCLATAGDLPQSTTLDCQGLLPSITLEAMGKDIRLLLDTGAREVILFMHRLEDLPRLSIGRFGRKIFHLGSWETIHRLMLRNVLLGAQAWGRFTAYSLNSEMNHYSGLEGIAGVCAFDFDCVEFDFANRRLSWSR